MSKRVSTDFESAPELRGFKQERRPWRSRKFSWLPARDIPPGVLANSKPGLKTEMILWSCLPRAPSEISCAERA
jgi:hypothetical protein